MTRKIAIITGSRGEYGYIRPIVREILRRPGMDYEIVVTNLHLLPEFGYSVEELKRDGFKISDQIYMALDGYTQATMSKSLGIFLMGVTDSLLRLKPDIVLLAGDRGEQLMAAVAAAHMNIPVAHIQAGELSGNIDGMTRHAIARYAHIHFASNADAAERLRKSGEQEFRIFLTGAPQLDELVNGEYAPREELERMYRIDPDQPLVLFVQHSVTEEYDQATRQFQETLEAVCELKHQTIIVFPNNDAGSEQGRQIIERYHRPFIRVERTLPRRLYLGLMRMASVMVGNSSSGLIEAPIFDLPAVNVGTRQRDRFRGPNVLDVATDRESIKEAITRALDPAFRRALRSEHANPYMGDGLVAQRIVDILEQVEIDEKLIKKQMAY
jgi:GDP/UDP-N,N'-diacetylbacillosamine 2-epimerase (hydrolysing)